MNKNILPLLGAVILLCCMVFALTNLDTADRWVGMWAPFVAAGVFLTLFGVILRRYKGSSI